MYNRNSMYQNDSASTAWMKVKETVVASCDNFNYEEEILDLCVTIIVVDAFIRCKIFKEPSGEHCAFIE